MRNRRKKAEVEKKCVFFSLNQRTTGPGSATPVVSSSTASKGCPDAPARRSSSLSASTRSERREQQTQPRSRETMSSLAIRLAETGEKREKREEG